MKLFWKTVNCASCAVSAILLPAIGLPADVPGWHRVGSAREDFDIRLDSEVRHGGNSSGLLECIGKNSQGTGTLEQDFQAEEYLGMRVRMSAWVRGETAGNVLIYIRAENTAGQVISYANSQAHAAHGTFDWRKHEAVLDVLPESTILQMGLILVQKGKAWIDDVELEIVDKKVHPTGPPFHRGAPNPRRAGLFVDHPALNLDFEQNAISRQ